MVELGLPKYGVRKGYEVRCPIRCFFKPPSDMQCLNRIYLYIYHRGASRVGEKKRANRTALYAAGAGADESLPPSLKIDGDDERSSSQLEQPLVVVAKCGTLTVASQPLSRAWSVAPLWDRFFLALWDVRLCEIGTERSLLLKYFG